MVKVADFSALDHSIISPMWVRASHEARIHIVGEPKSRILQNDKKIAPDFDMAEFLYIGSLKSA